MRRAALLEFSCLSICWSVDLCEKVTWPTYLPTYSDSDSSDSRDSNDSSDRSDKKEKKRKEKKFFNKALFFYI